MFKNSQEFVNTLQQTNQAAAAPGQPAAGGGSPVAMIMKALGIEPIPILSPTETAKMVTTESKVFSIYATGYVRSGKRETSVRIHAVVDFRGAPSPQQLIQQLLDQARTGTPPPGGTTQPPQNAGGSANSTSPGIPAALKPGPGGNIVYYRVD